jgi:TolA-binding protein
VYFNQKQYTDAAAEYNVFLQKYASDDRAASALFKIGLAQSADNEVQSAIDTLSHVIKTYPNTVEAANAKSKLRDLRARRRPVTQSRTK